ncbi:DUF2695 domain-containing protein [Georgenia subflava]|uniref:DUF2695 domain-containing protein n=1 Tax=Georgenia subflava TaxID=1622177 RepID=A0A6N7EE99_9MICO|nr:DUF2695 domain-containing protein [Georgenia subflava]MPV36752.1 DUF2695 domain-containing protein [Georgenia subflava]
MTVDDGVRTLEIELASLAEDLTTPLWRECVLCFANRMIVQFGCDSTLRWARRWRTARAPQATALERRLGRLGAYCDCEIYTNAFDVTVETVRDPDTGAECWPEHVNGCDGVRAGSTQPCSLWAPRTSRPWW